MPVNGINVDRLDPEVLIIGELLWDWGRNARVWEGARGGTLGGETGGGGWGNGLEALQEGGNGEGAEGVGHNVY